MAGVIVNIRPPNYRERFHLAFGCLGWRIVDSPVLHPEPLGAQLPDPQGHDAIIFTSQVAIDMLQGAGAWRDRTAYAVGAATAEAARRAGYAHVIQTGLDAKDLSAALAKARFHKAFYPSAEELGADVSLDDPMRIHRLAVYRMTPAARLSPAAEAAARTGDPLIVPLFSRRSGQAFERLLREADVAVAGRLAAVAISAEALGDAAGPWQRRAVADKPTMEAVVEKTAAMVADMSSEAQR